MGTERPTAAHAVAAQLQACGVTTVFMLPGEENLAVLDALHGTDIELVVCRHEQHAAFMAVAHARFTGSIGVCLATLGPGALNLFTGLAQAQLIGVPVLAITGQRALHDNDEGSFQLIDVVGSARPLVLDASTVTDPESAAAVVHDGVRQATQLGGAVLVELPEDIATSPVTSASPSFTPSATPVPDAGMLERLVDRIARADRPLVLAGAGCARPDVHWSLTRCCERSGLSVVATQMGKGSIDERHPRSLRSLGMHRPDFVHAALRRSDLIVAVGYSPVEHPPAAWRDRDQPVVHVHEHPAVIEEQYRPELEVVGDLPTTLERLGELSVPTDWADELRSAIDICLSEEMEEVGSGLSVAAAVGLIGEAIPSDATIALDNGLYKLWFARHHRAAHPHALVLDNALATMGAGLATGMEAARLGRQSVVVTGDGGLLMNLADVETAVRLGLDLTIVVLRDDAYGFIAWHQQEQGRDRVGVDLGNPDLGLVAYAFGARARSVRSIGALQEALAEAMTSPGVFLIDCPVDYGCNAVLERDHRPEKALALAEYADPGRPD